MRFASNARRSAFRYGHCYIKAWHRRCYGYVYCRSASFIATDPYRDATIFLPLRE